MRRAFLFILALSLLLSIAGPAQTQPAKKPPTTPTGQNPDDILNAPMTPPRSDSPGNEAPGSYSTSKDRVDISPPEDDSKHPGGDIEIAPSDDVMETKPWDPHEADKDVEVGMFYFKRSNYRAAELRFRDALHWQDNHAEATYRLAAVLEKEGQLPEARQKYEIYLKILPKGEFAPDAKKALERLNSSNEGNKKPQKKAVTSPPS